MSETPAHSLLVVEDHTSLGKTVSNLLETQPNVKAAVVVGSAEEAVEFLAREAVDLAVIDVSLPGMNGLELVAIIKRDYPHIRCLMLSGHVEMEYVRRALTAGAHGYVIKGKPLDLLEALHHVFKGEVFISDELLAA